jgi:hypothetical protein
VKGVNATPRRFRMGSKSSSLCAGRGGIAKVA